MTFESDSRRVGNRSYQVVSAVALGTILGDNGNLDNYLLQLSNAVAVFFLFFFAGATAFNTPAERQNVRHGGDEFVTSRFS